MPLLIAILLLIVLVFGISSSMQSYDTAQQAQAQIELARVAQADAAGNLVSLISLIVLVLLILMAAIAWLYIRRVRQLQQTGMPSVRVGSSQIRQPPTGSAPQLDSQQINMLIQLRILELLQPSRPQLPAPEQDQPVDEPLSWLKR